MSKVNYQNEHALALSYCSTAAKETNDHNDGTDSNEHVSTSRLVAISVQFVKELLELRILLRYISYRCRIHFNPDPDSKDNASEQLQKADTPSDTDCSFSLLKFTI